MTGIRKREGVQVREMTYENVKEKGVETVTQTSTLNQTGYLYCHVVKGQSKSSPETLRRTTGGGHDNDTLVRVNRTTSYSLYTSSRLGAGSGVCSGRV